MCNEHEVAEASSVQGLAVCVMQVKGSTAWAVIDRESINVTEPCAPMMHAEICRHAANVAEIACAAENPVKKRHFYLAMTSEFKVATPMDIATGLPPKKITTGNSNVNAKGLHATA